MPLKAEEKTTKSKEKKKPAGLLKLLKLLKPYSKLFWISIFFMILQSLFQIILPMLTNYMVTYGVNGASDANVRQSEFLSELGIAVGSDTIRFIGMIMIVFSVLSIGVSLGNTYFSSKVSSGYANILRRTMFYKVQSLSQTDIDKIGVASLITRTTNDVSQVQDMILNSLRTILTVPITLVLGLVFAISLNPKLMGFLGVVIPIILVFVVVMFVFIVPIFSKVQKLTDKLNQIVREKIGGIRVIRSFNKTALEDEKFSKTNFELTSLSLKATRIMASLLPFMVTILYTAVAMLMWKGGKVIETLDPALDYDRINATVGNLQAFMSYMMLIITGVTSIATIFVSIPRANVSARRINELLDMENSVQNPESPVEPDEENRGVLSFNNVSFTYPTAKKPSLENISFTCRPGEVTAIIGITGSGKSSVVNLIPRLYDVSEGSITLGGVDIRDMSVEQLHSRIAVVPQKAFLFSGTIEDNLKVGKPDATKEEMELALSVAQAKNFVCALPEGLNAMVSQGGNNFSGGQKQRLAIARAVIRDADIYIFDDSFSALDLATDARLRAGIGKELGDKNIIIVAQRIGTIMNADRILVMSGGRLVGMGKHDELCETCPQYKEIVDSQLGDNDGDDDDDGFMQELLNPGNEAGENPKNTESAEDETEKEGSDGE